MVDPGRGGMRALRAFVFLAVATGLTVVGHVLGGGSVSTLGVAALAVVVWPVALVGSARQRRVRHLLPALALGQFAGHAVLGYVDAAVGSLSAGTGCAPAGALHGHLLLDCTGSAMAMNGHVGTPAMTVAHLGAAVVLAVVLARGEALLWQVLALAVPVLPRLAPPVVEHLRATFVVRPSLRGLDVAVVPGRGPPVPA